MTGGQSQPGSEKGGVGDFRKSQCLRQECLNNMQKIKKNKNVSHKIMDFEGGKKNVDVICFNCHIT